MNGQRINRLVIHTPEGCDFSLLLAGPVTRFLAWLLDLLAVIVLVIAAFMALGLLVVGSGGLLGGVAGMLSFLIVFMGWFGYGIILEWFWGGRTLGKRMMGLRVIDERGLRLTFTQVAIRNLLRMVDMLPLLYLVGGVSCVLSRRCQRLGDLAAGTVVIRSRPVRPPDLSLALGDESNTFRAYPHIEARLRKEVSPRLAQLALIALSRRVEMNPNDRLLVFSEFAAQLRTLVDFPPALIDGLSDEHLVRNAVDSLFRATKA